ncbi:MAG: hypothetical protein AB7V16_09265 [Vulcanibacillus sp.]
MNIENNLYNFIDELNKINTRINDFYKSSQYNYLPLGDYVVEYIISYKRELISCLNSTDEKELKEFTEKIVEYSTKKTIETITKLNQYVKTNTIIVSRINTIYKNFVVKIFDKLISSDLTNLDWLKELVIDHQAKLREILDEIEELKFFPENIKLLGQIPCSEYSAPFQLNILNINIEDIIEPVLDFGCGENANLVNYLRKHGVEAYGVDRNVKEVLYTYQADWFDFELRSNYWGTIISHLSFTNHFKRTHLKKNGDYINYARKYMDLLNSLELGGSFFYTPDLPYIEQFLSSDLYLIKKISINKKMDFLKNSDFKVDSVQVKKLDKLDK